MTYPFDKFKVLTSLTLFSHNITLTVQKRLIVGYFFSITHPFEKCRENLLISYLFGQIWTMYNCTYKAVVLKSPGRVEFAMVAILDTGIYLIEAR